MVKMRRFRQELNDEENREILKRNTNIVLALNGPYALPLSYVYDGEHIYMHTAKEGYKLELIKKDNRVSFTVIDKDQIVPEKFTTYYRSIIGNGRIFIVNDEKEKRYALELLGDKYSSEYHHLLDNEISGSINNVCILRIDIEELRGKEAIELRNSHE